MTWRLVDHTADVAIECDGPTKEVVLADAGVALTSVATGVEDPHAVPAEDEVALKVEAPDEEALVVAWLSELLWLFESEDLLWLGGGVELGGSPNGGFRLTATGNVARYDPARHGQGTEVKAVTYHDMAFRRRNDGSWHLRVVLDI